MRVWDAGHTYALSSLDGGDVEILRFVKREGKGYPGNNGSHPGTTIQEVLRALIHRIDYLDNQIPDENNTPVREALQTAIFYLEVRAAKRHGRIPLSSIYEIETLPTCLQCLHIGCEGGCQKHTI